MTKPPIIILGAPRSGTTVLGEILSQHPDVHYLVEPNPLWRRHAATSGDLIGPAQHADVIKPTRAIFARLLDTEPGKRLLEKTPQNCLRVPFVHAVFPEAKFIHIIRDGVESSLSIAKFWETRTSGLQGVRIGQRLKELSPRQVPYYARQLIKRLLPAGKTPRVYWGPVLPGMAGLVRDLSIPEVAALQWRTCVELACHYGRSLDSGQYLELRLEDLDGDAVRDILEFVDLPPSAAVDHAVAEHFQMSKTAHRRKGAKAEEIEQILKWIEPTRQWLGQS